MADSESETPEDPWLTLAEVAEQLRMSPATIRSWVANGTLRAMRPGKRKLLVRRSELDRMLAGEDMYDPDQPDATPPEGESWRQMDIIQPPGRSPHWPPEAVQHVTRAGWLGSTETEWRNVLRASAMAAPDIGFAFRLREIANAAARKAAAFANLEDQAPGPWWERQSSLPGGVLSYELRPAANRPGPTALWARFDTAVENLAAAMDSRSVSAERAALEELSLVTHEIVDALVERNVYPWPTDWEPEDDDDGPVDVEDDAT